MGVIDLNSISPFIFIISGFTSGVCFKILWDNKNDLSKSKTSLLSKYEEDPNDKRDKDNIPI